MPKKTTFTKAADKKKSASVETSESIAAQTALFLESGGKIELIQNGISGQLNTSGKKHISFSKNKSGTC